MSLANHVTLRGRLGRDPEQRQAGERPVVNFSLATTETWRDKSGQKAQQTEWHQVEVWARQGENCVKYLKKGSLVHLSGRLKYDKYEKDGRTITTARVVADRVDFLDKAPAQSKSAQAVSNGTGDPGYGEDPGDVSF